MAAHNTGVSQRTLAPDTMERFRIGTAEQNRDAPTQKQASPAFLFTGAGSSSPVQPAALVVPVQVLDHLACASQTCELVRPRAGM